VGLAGFCHGQPPAAVGGNEIFVQLDGVLEIVNRRGDLAK